MVTAGRGEQQRYEPTQVSCTFEALVDWKLCSVLLNTNVCVFWIILTQWKVLVGNWILDGGHAPEAAYDLAHDLCCQSKLPLTWMAFLTWLKLFWEELSWWQMGKRSMESVPYTQRQGQQGLRRCPQPDAHKARLVPTCVRCRGPGLLPVCVLNYNVASGYSIGQYSSRAHLYTNKDGPIIGKKIHDAGSVLKRLSAQGLACGRRPARGRRLPGFMAAARAAGPGRQGARRRRPALGARGPPGCPACERSRGRPSSHLAGPSPDRRGRRAAAAGWVTAGRNIVENAKQKPVKPARYFSELEKSILLALVEKCKYVLERKESDARTPALKQRTWQALAHESSSQPSVSLRDFKRLKKCWEDIKARTKKIMAHERREKVKRSVSRLLSTHVLGKETVASMRPGSSMLPAEPAEEEHGYRARARANAEESFAVSNRRAVHDEKELIHFPGCEGTSQPEPSCSAVRITATKNYRSKKTGAKPPRKVL
ncbi:uncharacterized protein LOC102519805 [Camelus ferus]|uniref:Myb/SANT-like DNA-binding domain-containing protein 3 n=1 Tax=Camelus ferus TaxID=419612 RepID=A0A8B8SEX4_CAMFR|nr:uncharacterized protein LOC102519805 [Camelus ferus]